MRRKKTFEFRHFNRQAARHHMVNEPAFTQLAHYICWWSILISLDKSKMTKLERKVERAKHQTKTDASFSSSSNVMPWKCWQFENLCYFFIVFLFWSAFDYPNRSDGVGDGDWGSECRMCVRKFFECNSNWMKTKSQNLNESLIWRRIGKVFLMKFNLKVSYMCSCSQVWLFWFYSRNVFGRAEHFTHTHRYKNIKICHFAYVCSAFFARSFLLFFLFIVCVGLSCTAATYTENSMVELLSFFQM